MLLVYTQYGTTPIAACAIEAAGEFIAEMIRRYGTVRVELEALK